MIGRRGQPVIALAAILGGWFVFRVMTWDAHALTPQWNWTEVKGPSAQGSAPFAQRTPDTPVSQPRPAGKTGLAMSAPELVSAYGAMSIAPVWNYLAPQPIGPFVPQGWGAQGQGGQSQTGQGWVNPYAYQARTIVQQPVIQYVVRQLTERSETGGWFNYALPNGEAGFVADSVHGRGRGHSLSDTVLAADGFGVSPLRGGEDLLRAGFAGRRAASGPGGNAAPMVRAVMRSPHRFSGDAWVLMRKGGASAIAGGAVPAAYGANQAGAVLRYALAPGRSFDPRVYGRATTALGSVTQAEVAAGFSARPLKHAPIIASAEIRAMNDLGGTHIRPAVMAVTQIPPFSLPMKLEGQTYLQGGYVGGYAATAFLDGEARADRDVTDLGIARLKLGAGVWGGVQKGASRLDAGPTATLGFSLKDRAQGRLSADWRFKVTGNAAPDSGPAVTFAAGF